MLPADGLPTQLVPSIGTEYKWYITLVASALVVCIAYGSSYVTGGLGLVEDQYNVSLEVAILTCSIMVCGFAVGPLLWSPLSEIIGRRPDGK